MRSSGLFVSAICFVSGALAQAESFSAAEVARILTEMPSPGKVDCGKDGDLLIEPLLRVSQGPSASIREGLVIFEESLNKTAKNGMDLFQGYLKVDLLIRILFEYPKGRISDLPAGQMSYVPVGESGKLRAANAVVEYCLPIQVTDSGVIRLGWEYGGFAGLIPRNFAAFFDRMASSHPSRKIDYTVQPCLKKPMPSQPLQPTRSARG